MTICHERKLIFIHIPKNAGTSVIKAMVPKAGERLKPGQVDNVFFDKPIEEYKKHYQDYWNEYKKFTVVRDPIDRFISAYKYARMEESGWFSAKGEGGLDKHMHYELCNEMDINEYTLYLYKNPNKFTRWNIPQTFAITDDNYEMEIDFFLRFENLHEDLKKIGIENIQKLNSSKIENDKVIQLTKKSKMILYEVYDIDYKNFNYKKEPIYNYS